MLLRTGVEDVMGNYHTGFDIVGRPMAGPSIKDDVMLLVLHQKCAYVEMHFAVQFGLELCMDVCICMELREMR